MKFKLNIPAVVYISFIAISFFFVSNICLSFDVNNFIENFEKNDKQTVLTGHIDTLVIIRGNAEFHLGPGELTLFDFGWERPSAIFFKGKCHFTYIPPDPIEANQLKKFTKKEMVDLDFDEIIIFFTVPIILPDYSYFIKEDVDKKVWKKMVNARRDAFYHLGIYVTNKLISDLVSESPGLFFYADFRYKKFEHLVFCEDPFPNDLYRLFKLRREGGRRTFDVYSAYTPIDYPHPSWQHLPIDIKKYHLNVKIESNGEMTVKCRIFFLPLYSGQRFLHLNWFPENEALSAYASNGEQLQIVTRVESFRLFEETTEEHGFGLVLNESIKEGEDDYIDINYKCGIVENIIGRYYLHGQNDWYPKNIIHDPAKYEMTFDYPENIQIISGGKKVESLTQDGRTVSKWIMEYPVEYITFNIGNFGLIDITGEAIHPVKIYMNDTKLIGQVGADIANSAAFFTDIFGPCPFDTIKIVEIPYGNSKNSPGLIHLSWKSFIDEDLEGYYEQHRASYVALQWLEYELNYQSYRDRWIIDGLANYSGLWFYELLSKNTKSCHNILYNMRRLIAAGIGRGSEGTYAGPVTLGYRLASSKSKDYDAVIINKGAYIFHMIRYLFHDFKTDSDELFVEFLKKLIERYRNEPITTNGLQSVLEESLGDMSWFFDQWVYGTDIPEYRFSYDYEKTPEGKYQVTCHVKQRNVPDDFKMVVPLTVIFENDQFTHLKLWIYQPEQDITLPLLPLEPKKIEFNTYDAVLCNVKYE